MRGLRELVTVNTNTHAPLNANVSGQSVNTVSNFVTVQSLGTFAIAVPILKTIWELLDALIARGWTASYWTPFVICLVYGAWQFGLSVSGESGAKTSMERFSAAMIATVNAAVLAAAVIGLTETTGVGEDG